jgi:hypothetical protein
MNEQLSADLAYRVTQALPHIDRAVGIARLNTETIVDGNDTRIVKLPVPIVFTAADCERDGRYLVPDATTKGILFLEDGGSVVLDTPQRPRSHGFRQSSLRLLLWTNEPLLAEPLSETTILLAIEEALQVGRRYTQGDYLDIFTTAAVLPAETSLYGRYSFDTKTELLLPPYRLTGLDLRLEYRYRRCVGAPAPEAAPGFPYLFPLDFD